MKQSTFYGFLLTACLLVCAGTQANAQGPGGGHPPGPPPGGHAPGMPPANGGPGGAPPNGGPPAGGPDALSHTTSVTAAGGIKLGPPGRWWDDDAFIRTIGLSREQKKKMDSIFDANKPAIVATYKTFESEQAKLNALTKDPQADKAKVFAGIDAVNQARASLQKANTQMLLQIRQQLAPAQVAKLDSLP